MKNTLWGIVGAAFFGFLAYLAGQAGWHFLWSDPATIRAVYIAAIMVLFCSGLTMVLIAAAIAIFFAGFARDKPRNLPMFKSQRANK